MKLTPECLHSNLELNSWQEYKALPGFPRLSVGDQRWYTTPSGLRPSITTILSATESKQSRDRLKKKAQDPATKAAWDLRRDEGSKVHEVLSYYFRSPLPREWGEFLPHGMLQDEEGYPLPQWAANKVMEGCEFIRPFIQQLKEFDRLQRIEEVVWSEGPLLDEHKQTIGIFDGQHWMHQHPRVWSDINGGFAGCPDLRCIYAGKDTIVDIKTALEPYIAVRPSFQSGKYYSWYKYHKAAMQLTAYDLGFQHALEMPPAKQLTVFVVTPNMCQLLTVPEEEREQLQIKFLKKVEEFHEMQQVEY